MGIDSRIDCSKFNHPKLNSAPGYDDGTDKNFYHDYSYERIKIYHCTVSNRNPVT